MHFTHCLCQQTTFFRSPRYESRRTPKLGAESLSSVLCAVCLFESVRSEAPNARSPEAKPLAGCYACRQTGVILQGKTLIVASAHKVSRKGDRGTLAFQIFMGSFEKGVGKRKAVWLKWKA